MLEQVSLAHFEPVMTRVGPWKMPKCFENGPFWDQKCVKSGSQTRFPQGDHAPFGKREQVFSAHFQHVATGFGPWRMPKYLDNGPFWDQKWVKN